VAIVNAAVVFVLAILIWDEARVLKAAWSEILRVRQSDQVVAEITTESGQLQSLMHRYFTQPSPAVLSDIEQRRMSLWQHIRRDVQSNPLLAYAAERLRRSIDRLVTAFDDLRAIRADIAQIYAEHILRPAREIDSTMSGGDSLIRPSLGKSREAFSAVLVAMNAYYLSLSANAGEEARQHLTIIQNTIPVMLDLSDNAMQKGALERIAQRVQAIMTGLEKLTAAFERQTTLLRDAVDQSRSELTAAAHELTASIREHGRAVQDRLDTTLSTMYTTIAVVTALSLGVIVFFGAMIARSIRVPLSRLREAMDAIVAGRLQHQVAGLTARDEIGTMARAIEVFRGNAIAKLQAEADLRASKAHIENAYTELRNTQHSLIEAEKLAALGGLVAGVAHEVNNPVGISLTVASSLQRRCEEFSSVVASGELRRSRLTEFIQANREAANQLVANLLRAGELIESCKQVAVDRSHTDRRSFDLKRATEQILASLRPSLSKRDIALDVQCPEGICMDSYPGYYGQIITNLFINAVHHAFAGRIYGAISLLIHLRDADTVALDFVDDGVGMTPEVRRQAFEPFFTTLRGQGGTGLGLHIVHNIVTGRLGGTIHLQSEVGRGTAFHVTLPRVAPGDPLTE
jgi:signal transduction histidine kinase